MVEIANLRLRRLEIPLTEPYHLSFTTIRAFETILVEITLTDGRKGLGEATPLKGYSDESADTVWTVLSDFGAQLVGSSLEDAQAQTEIVLKESPFAHSAVDCAIQTATMSGLEPMSVPTVGILSTSDPVVNTAVQSQLDEGFETIKVKVGFDPERDARRLSRIAELVPETVSLRTDANQGYSLAEARCFLDAAPTDRLQLVEQPLPVGSLSDHAALEQEYDVPIMLDEEIQKQGDVQAAADTGAASAVKFKLMKVGGWTATQESIQTAQDLGFDVVLGNGVQSDVGCIHEAALWSTTGLDLAGEFNGWRKQNRQITNAGLQFRDGCLEWQGGAVRLDSTAVDTVTVGEQRYGQ